MERAGVADRTWREVERVVTSPTAVTVATTRSGDSGLTWWRGVHVEEAPATLEPGAIVRLAVRSPIGYRLRISLTIVEVAPGRALSATSAGDLRGRGRLRVERDGDAASVVVFHWDVATERRWMNVGARALRPAFERAHAHVMRAGSAVCARSSRVTHRPEVRSPEMLSIRSGGGCGIRSVASVEASP
nr:hypothetical protein GCM10025699_27870 [Microbacterium flavescens]